MHGCGLDAGFGRRWLANVDGWALWRAGGGSGGCSHQMDQVLVDDEKVVESSVGVGLGGVGLV